MNINSDPIGIPEHGTPNRIHRWGTLPVDIRLDGTPDEVRCQIPLFHRASPPSQRCVKLLGPVPGAHPGAGNVYALDQALSWVSSHRNDVTEADQMQREIPNLIHSLMRN